MKKALKFIRKLLLICFAVLLAMGTVSKYAWRLFGFKLCAPPESYNIYSVEMSGNLLAVQGYTSLPSWFPFNFGDGYGGHTIKQEGSTVYIGIKKTSGFKKASWFVLEIPVQEPVEHILLTDGKSEVSIYDRMPEH